jgi:hypothetical protein
MEKDRKYYDDIWNDKNAIIAEVHLLENERAREIEHHKKQIENYDNIIKKLNDRIKTIR